MNLPIVVIREVLSGWCKCRLDKMINKLKSIRVKGRKCICHARPLLGTWGYPSVRVHKCSCRASVYNKMSPLVTAALHALSQITCVKNTDNVISAIYSVIVISGTNHYKWH